MCRAAARATVDDSSAVLRVVATTKSKMPAKSYRKKDASTAAAAVEEGLLAANKYIDNDDDARERLHAALLGSMIKLLADRSSANDNRSSSPEDLANRVYEEAIIESGLIVAPGQEEEEERQRTKHRTQLIYTFLDLLTICNKDKRYDAPLSSLQNAIAHSCAVFSSIKDLC